MNAWTLPTSVMLNDVEYELRTDFRAVLDVMEAMNDPELDEHMKAVVMLKIMYPDYREIPAECLEAAMKKACDFIDCGVEKKEKSGPRMIDWAKDAALMAPAVNKIAGKEVRTAPYVHWWTFYGMFGEIQEGLFFDILLIRQKMADKKRLDKQEMKFYKANKDIIDLKTNTKKRSEQEINELRKLLGFKKR